MSQLEVEGTVNANGDWTQHSVVRETNNDGSIDFEPTELPGSGLCIRLRNAANGAVFSDTVCWLEDDLSAKTLASDVLAHTRFTIEAHGAGGTRFRGELFTE